MVSRFFLIWVIPSTFLLLKSETPSNSFKLVQNRLKSSKIVQNRPNLTKCADACLNQSWKCLCLQIIYYEPYTVINNFVQSLLDGILFILYFKKKILHNAITTASIKGKWKVVQTIYALCNINSFRVIAHPMSQMFYNRLR